MSGPTDPEDIAKQAHERRKREAKAFPGSPDAPAGSGQATGVDDSVPEDKYGDMQSADSTESQEDPPEAPEPGRTVTFQSTADLNVETLVVTRQDTLPHEVRQTVIGLLAQSDHDADIHRVGVWSGTADDRPGRGHDHGILQHDW